MYLTHVGFGLSLTEVGGLFGRERTRWPTLRTVEDRRDDARLDRCLDALEDGRAVRSRTAAARPGIGGTSHRQRGRK